MDFSIAVKSSHHVSDRHIAPEVKFIKFKVFKSLLIIVIIFRCQTENGSNELLRKF